MSEADKMFEELGYIKYESKYNIYYTAQFGTEIAFNKKDKDVTKYWGMENQYIDMQELKAINKKCEELGWI